MPSPFPGMNPFLEQSNSWEDFHQDYMTRMREALAGPIGDNYLVKLEVRLYIHELSADERRFFGQSDAGVIIQGPASRRSGSVDQSAAAPFELALPAVEIERQTSVEIVDRWNRNVVTVIELLSPTNKAPGLVPPRPGESTQFAP